MYLFSVITLFSFLPISMMMGNFVINLNIILLDVLLILTCIIQKKWSWCKTKSFYLLLLFYFYLIFNSLFNYYQNNIYGIDGILRSVSFIKFLFFIYSFKVLIPRKEIFTKIMFYWLITISIVVFDVFFEKYFGFNTLNFKSLDSTRIISFFYDENIVGSFLFCFGFITCAYFLEEREINFNKKLFINTLIIFLLIAVLFSGERSNFIKSFILFNLIIIFIKPEKLILKKSSIILILIASIIGSILISEKIYIKQTEFFKRLMVNKDANTISGKIDNIKYFAHYDAAWKIFQNFPATGIGSKNFRIECQKDEYFNEGLSHSINRCNTHPHQVHFELLSEQGLIGYIFFFYLILSSLKNRFNYHKQNIFFLSVNFYILIFLIPILPGGSIFSTTNGFTFWIIFAVLIYLNKKNLSN